MSKKNHATSLHTKTTQPIHTQNHATTQQKHCENRKTHWLSNVLNWSFQKFWKRFFYSINSSDSSEKFQATSPHKNMHPLYFFYFFSTFWKCQFTHLTTDVMFSGPQLAILAMFEKGICKLMSVYQKLWKYPIRLIKKN